MIALINPKSANWGFRVPNSLLTLGAFLEGRYDYTIIDENLGISPVNELAKLIQNGVKYIGITVMPALQLRGAYSISKEIKTRFPDVKIIWGGYFPSMHPNTVLKSPYIDFVLKGHAEYSFIELIDSLEAKPGAKELKQIAGLSFKHDGVISHNIKAEPIDPDLIPRLPYHRVDVDKYLSIGRTYLGPRTIGYHSSVGCPFLCGFCAVAGIYKGKWLGRSAELTASDIIFLKEKYNIGAVEFHDNNFFVAEKRVYDFAKAVNGLGIGWWGEARPDTVMKFSDDTWQMMADAGCKMIFYGAETSNDELLMLMHKGGTQNAQTLLDLAEKSKKYGIVPELSFVLGNPTDNVTRDIETDLKFIKKIKAINPAAEIVIYTYSPVNFEDSEMSLAAKLKGFDYPKSLEEWVSPKWQNFDLRKNPLTPWLKPHHFKMIRNFEKTLNAYYPTNSDLKIRGWKRSLLQLLGSWRYKTDFYTAPYEIMLTQKLLKYRQPEIEGFAQS
ncbi:MAG: B12-binding domain-containing radical SAM protein [Ignavibacteria bacterium]|nr:B12-binding domain-containing radical SAM protein [Ignavibacteria bacterium]